MLSMGDGYFIGGPNRRRGEQGLLPPYVEAALFLLCGMIIGGGVTVLLMNRSMQQMVTQPSQLQNTMLSRMESRLELTESQKKDATAIIEKHFESLETIRRETQPRVKRTMDAMRNELAGILDENQRKIWEERFDAIRGNWVPGPLSKSETDGTQANPG